MLGLREVKQTEADVIKAVKTAIETCDAEELKTKKFVGLLNDFIKDQSGLKIRLELLGKSGMIPLIDKTLKEPNPTLKIEKMAQQFSKNYGFTQDVTAKTFEILTLALSNKKMSAPVTLKIVEPVQAAQGGFSKKHFTQPIVEKSGANANKQATIKVQQPNEGSGKRKKWVRNTLNLWAYILLLVAIPFGYIGLNAYYDKLLDLETVFVTRFHPHFYVETSFVVAVSLMIFAIFSPYFINWTTKKNTLSFYPLAALFFQVITFQLASTDLRYYMDLQMLFGIGTLISFAVLGFYAMRLPKGAYDYTAYRSIGPYYLITCIWMVGQYIVYSKAFGIWEVIMSDLLKIGTTILSEGVPYKIVDELGSGGQGTVYKVSDESSLYALKWYNRQSSTPEQYHAIEALIEKGAPNERFVWPIAMAEGNTSENFGYLMPLVDVKRFTKLSHYFGSEMGVRRYEPIITACIQMAHSFYDLHLSGLCYRDISFGNIFIDFNSGDVQICDNDNVAFDNLTESEENWGTQGFMAPEIILGEKPPSSLSDLFSLSVVLFRMLHFQHPLQGKREYEIEIADFEALMDLYGKHPVFIYDPHDDSNRPVKGKKDMADYFWPFYPESVRSRFVEAFTVGLTNPELRVRESIWIKELALLKSALMYCYSCGNQVFYRRECLNGNFTCPHCHKEIGYLPPRLKVGNRILLLNHDTVLYENQIFESNLMDYDKKFLKVEVHPVHEKFWGIRNLTETAWRVVGNEGNEKLIKTDEVLTMVEGLNIDFGTALGSIKLGTNRRKPQ